MGRETPGTLNLYTIIKNSDVNVICNAVIPVQNCVCYNFMQRFIRIFNIFQGICAEPLDFLNNRSGLSDSIVNLKVRMTLHRYRGESQRIPTALNALCSVTVYFYPAPFRQKRLR